jgi:hypothetical protein
MLVNRMMRLGHFFASANCLLHGVDLCCLQLAIRIYDRAIAASRLLAKR